MKHDLQYGAALSRGESVEGLNVQTEPKPWDRREKPKKLSKPEKPKIDVPFGQYKPPVGSSQPGFKFKPPQYKPYAPQEPDQAKQFRKDIGYRRSTAPRTGLMPGQTFAKIAGQPPAATKQYRPLYGPSQPL